MKSAYFREKDTRKFNSGSLFSYSIIIWKNYITPNNTVLYADDTTFAMSNRQLNKLVRSSNIATMEFKEIQLLKFDRVIMKKLSKVYPQFRQQFYEVSSEDVGKVR